MEVMKSFNSDLGVLQRKMASFAGAVAFETLLAAQASLARVLMMTGFQLQDTLNLQKLIGHDQRFPFSDLYKKGSTEPEAKDGSDTEDDDVDDNEAEEPQDDDDGDEDFSGEEKEDDDDDDDDDDEGDAGANGNQGSDDEDDDDGEDDDEDEDEDEEEEEEDEDDDEEEQPPAKKRK